jgi:uncharacterized protein YndB with AHSA1/START domain
MDIQTFDWSTFTIKTVVQAPLNTIYKAWTCTAEIERWFLLQAAHYEGDELLPGDREASAGTTYDWRWYLFEDTEQGRYTEANGTDFLQFSFAGQCLVDIQLKTTGEFTEVVLTQKNIPTDDQSKRSIRLGCHGGWSFYLVNLKSVYEGGLDLRNKDERFKGLVNN